MTDHTNECTLRTIGQVVMDHRRVTPVAVLRSVPDVLERLVLTAASRQLDERFRCDCAKLELSRAESKLRLARKARRAGRRVSEELLEELVARRNALKGEVNKN